jgi:hypothetical protein
MIAVVERAECCRGGGRLLSASRGLGLFAGGLTLANLLAQRMDPGFDANLWWIDLRPLPPEVAHPLIAATAGLLVLHAVRPAASGVRRVLTVLCASVLAAITATDAARFHVLLARQAIRSTCPVPLSALSLAALIAIALAARRVRSDEAAAPLLPGVFAATLLACACGFPLAQMVC